MDEVEMEQMEWESNLEYNYRIETGKIIVNIAKNLGRIEKISKSKDKDFSIYSENLKKQKNYLNNLLVPERYYIAQGYLLKSINAYVLSGNFLEDGVNENDVTLTYKASRYIKEGTAWMEIAKIRIWEAVEDAVIEFKNKKLKLN